MQAGDLRDTAAGQWFRASQFGSDQAPSWPDSEEAADEIATLSTLPYFRQPEAQIEMRMFEGVLAVHQAGAYASLYHPFRENCSLDSEKIWSDRDLIKSPKKERPFPPQLIPKSRCILFSSPSGVSALNLWSVKDWANDGESCRYWTVIDFTVENSQRLACQPIILEDATSGIVTLCEEGEESVFYWQTFKLASDRGEVTEIAEKVALPLEGRTCKVELVADQVLAISTSVGHWVWKVSDATKSNVEAVQRTWAAPDGSRESLDVALDQTHELAFSKPTSFIWNRGEESETFSWFFRVKQDGGCDCQWYAVNLKSLKAETPTSCHVDAHPLGLISGETEEILLAYEQTLALLHFGKADPMHSVEDFEEVSGYQFRDPILLTITKSRNTSAGRLITIRSTAAKYKTRTAKVEVPPLRSNPLIWSKWLFTIEEPEKGTINLCRRFVGHRKNEPTRTNSEIHHV